MRNLVDCLNLIADNVWAIVIILIGVLLAVLSIWHHDLLATGGTVIAVGGTAFNKNRERQS